MTSSYPKEALNNSEPKTNKPSYQQCLLHLTEQLQNYSFIKAADIDELESNWKFFYFKKGESFIKPGDTCDSILFIHKGSLKHYIQDKEKKYIIDFFVDGQFCMASNSFRNQVPAQKGFIFTEDSYGVRLSYNVYKKLIRINPAYEDFLNEKAEENNNRILNRLKSFLSMNTKGRYELVVKEIPGIFSRFTMQDISNYLGVKPETLSRMRSSIKNKK